MAIYSIPEWVEHEPTTDDPWHIGTRKWTIAVDGEELAVITECIFHLEAKATNHKGQVRVRKFSHLSEAKRWCEQVVFSHRDQ